MAQEQWYTGAPEGARFRDKVTGQVLEIRGGRPVVVGSNAYPQSAEDVAAMKDMQTNADRLNTLSQGAQQFVQRQHQNQTWSGPAMQDTHFKLFGNDIEIPSIARAANNLTAWLGNPAAADTGKLDSVNAEYWSKLRDKGSGPIRNYEAQGPAGWQRAFPNTSNWPAQNDDIAQRLQQDAHDTSEQLSWRRSYLAHGGPGGVQGADASYRAWVAAGRPVKGQNPAGNTALQARSAAAPKPPASKPITPQNGQYTDQQLRQMFGG